MKEYSPFEHTPPSPSPRTASREELFQKNMSEGLERRLRYIYQQYQTREERINSLREFFDPYREFFGDDMIEAINTSLGEISSESEDDFVTQVAMVANPLKEKAFSDPYNFEAFLRTFSNNSETHIKLNQLINYEKKDGYIVMHIEPNYLTSDVNKKTLMIEGLRALARIVNDDPSIQFVSGESWIIKKNPNLVSLFGFEVSNSENTDPEFGFAKISREKLIELYL